MKRSNSVRKNFVVSLCSFALVCIIIATTFISGSGNSLLHAVINTPKEINDLGYLGRGVNLLRDIDKNDKSDDLLAQNHLKMILDNNELSDFTISKDPISTSYGQGYTSKSFASLATSIGVDLSTKSSMSSDFIIGSAKINAGFSMSMNTSVSANKEWEYTIYNYQKYLDSWTLNWNNGGIKDNAAVLREHLDASVYGALTDTFPQYVWSPKDFFDTYGTHMILSYKRGGEYTYTSIEESQEIKTSIDSSASLETSASTSVSSFGEASFEQKVKSGFAVDENTNGKFRKTCTYSRGSSKGQINTSDHNSFNTWGDGVDDKNAQVLSSGLTLISMWDLLPSQYASRKAELKNYYNEKVAGIGNDILDKFVYKTANEGDFDFSQYDTVISSAGQLNEIRNNMKGRYILACDIDLGHISNWEPIGTETNRFTGIFDGNGNTITNMNIMECDNEYVGLFGYSTGTIKNLSVSGTISLNESQVEGVGAIVGYNAGIIDNCHNEVIIDSTINYVKNDTDDTSEETKPTVDTEALFKDAKVISPVAVSELSEEVNDTTVIDLRNLDGKINKTIHMKTGAESLRLIGNPNVKYVGLTIEVENSEFERYIALDNVNIEYVSENGAITSNSSTKVWLISEGEKNSIRSNTKGIASAIKVVGDLEIIGKAKLSIMGSEGKAGSVGAENGTNGSGAGASGKPGSVGGIGNIGGIGIIADKVVINVESELEIIGGTGGQGGVGGKGANGLKGSNAGFIWVGGGNGGAGGNGGEGGVGGQGGAALNVNKLIVYSGTVTVKGGAGGQGGQGGTGGNGGAGGKGVWASDGKQGNGGQGGVGGRGGLFGDAVVFSSTEIRAYSGAQLILFDNGVGLGGQGGAGGNGGSGKIDGNVGKAADVPNNKQRIAYYSAIAKYSLYDANVTYDEAKRITSTLGMQENLISIHGDRDQNIIETMFKYYDTDQSKMFWIGGERAERNLNKWNWEDRGTFEYDYREKKYNAYTNWAEGQPTSALNADFIGIDLSSGKWYARSSNVIGGFITKETLIFDSEAQKYDIYIGGVVGYNKGTVRQSLNDSEMRISLKSKDDFIGVISGIVGLNEGKVDQVANRGKIDVSIIPDDNPELCADVTISQITKNSGFGELISYKNTGEKGKIFGDNQYIAPLIKWDWKESTVAVDKSENYNGEWEEDWQKDRVHVIGIEKTDFLLGEVLSNNIIELSYVDSVTGKRANSSMYSYKYDFSNIGVSGIKISFTYKDQDGTDVPKDMFIPVRVAENVISKVEIDYVETKIDYQYGDDFICPIITKTMSDGSSESIIIDEDFVYNVPAMTHYGSHEILVHYNEYQLTYTINIAQKVIEPTAAQLKIQNRTTVADGNVIVQFSFVNMEELKSILFYSFNYDHSKMEIVEGRWIADGIIHDWDPEREMATFTYAYNQESNRVVFELEIKIKEDCPAGEYTLSCAALVNTVDEKGYDRAVSLEVAPGNISVIDIPRGDFNNDGYVDEDDATYLLRHTLFGNELFELNQSGDVNGDNIVNSDDAIYLLRYTLLPEEYPLYW